MNFPFFFFLFFFEISRALYRSNDTAATRQSMLQPTSRESVQHERNLSRLRGNFVLCQPKPVFLIELSPVDPPFEKFYSYPEDLVKCDIMRRKIRFFLIEIISQVRTKGWTDVRVRIIRRILISLIRSSLILSLQDSTRDRLGFPSMRANR